MTFKCFHRESSDNTSCTWKQKLDLSEFFFRNNIYSLQPPLYFFGLFQNFSVIKQQAVLTKYPNWSAEHLERIKSASHKIELARQFCVHTEGIYLYLGNPRISGKLQRNLV